MDFSFTDEQELLRESVVEFCDRYIDDSRIDEMYKNHKIDDEISLAYMENGFGIMGLPEEYGGIPCDKVTLGVLTEEFAHSSGLVAPYLNATLALQDLVEFGNADQIAQCMDTYLETGLPILSLGFSEPGAGCDNQAMASVVRKQADGTYRLNGQKTWVTNGETLPYCLVVAKDEDPSRENRNMSMWLVPRETEGLSTSALHKIGQQIMPFCDMYFDDVVLTEDMRVGNPGEGFINLMRNFETERCLIISQCIGLAQACMDDAAAYVSERIAFNKPISSFQCIQEKLTDMEIALQNARNMLYHTLWKADNGESIRIDSALLKRYGAQAAFFVADQALQIYAGLGYTTESRLGRIMMDLRGMRIAGGTDEIMVYIAGRALAKKYARK